MSETSKARYTFSGSLGEHSTHPEVLSPRSHLGRTTDTPSFILPVPGYITEYEEAYKWPPLEAYQASPHSSGSGSPKWSKKIKDTWSALENSALKLLASAEHGHKPGGISATELKQLLSSVIATIHYRKLDDDIENAYKTFSKARNSRTSELEEFINLVEELKGVAHAG